MIQGLDLRTEEDLVLSQGLMDSEIKKEKVDHVMMVGRNLKILEDTEGLIRILDGTGLL